MIEIIEAGYEQLNECARLLKENQEFRILIDDSYYNKNVDFYDVARKALKSDNSKIYLAVKNYGAKYVYYCGLLYVYKDDNEEYDCAHNDNVIIKDIIVDKNCNGMGIGRLLINKATQYAKSVGCSQIKLVTHYHNVESHKFYQKTGFDFKELVLTLDLKKKE